VATYRLYTNCNFCEEGHPFPFAISLEIEYTNMRSVGDIYMGKKPPGDIVSIMRNRIQCSKSGEFFVQNDKNQVYLVPTG